MDKPTIHPFDMFELMEKATTYKEIVKLESLYNQDTAVKYTGSRPEFLSVL